MTRQELYQLLDDSIPLPFLDPRQVLNKDQSIKQYVSYMLNRTNSMFEYENLPNTIPAYMLELYLQIFGFCAFTHIDDSTTIMMPSLDKYKTPEGHYIFYGNIGGERDIYYRPTLFIAANPRLKNSVNKTVVYDEEHIDSIRNPCVLIKNDTNFMGLLPLFSRYAAQLCENDISIRSAQINARAQIGICASTDRDSETARKYLDDLEAGKLGIIGETSFLEGVTVSNVGTQSANHIIQLIELQQYLKASWYNELGLNVNFNMKREYMSEEEIAVNTDILLPLVDDMYKNRLEAIDLINKVFDLDIKVSKSSAWANKEQEELAALSEAANSGEIPLNEVISDKIYGDANGEKENVQTHGEANVSSGEAGSSVDETHEMGVAGSADSGTELEPQMGGQQAIAITINAESVEIDAGGGETNVLEETPQESEESDSN